MTKPCDEACPKCGHTDIFRQFRREGDRWMLDRLGDRTGAFRTVTMYSAVANMDHVDHCCRCCGYRWGSKPLGEPC